MSETIYKNIGETPLEALERFRASRPELEAEPMTYAGRLDPMAEGQLLILIGEECKQKERYLGLDKEYEVEIVFGISTDTYDALGIPKVSPRHVEVTPWGQGTGYIGKFTQEYPPYSSKTVNGKQLHELARAGELPDEMPTKDVEIYSLDVLNESTISSAELKSRIFSMIDKVTGDFRQEEIKKRWGEVLGMSNDHYSMIKVRVYCSSGTYMRSLANRIGKDAGVGAFALSIKRTKVIQKLAQK